MTHAFHGVDTLRRRSRLSFRLLCEHGARLGQKGARDRRLDLVAFERLGNPLRRIEELLAHQIEGQDHEVRRGVDPLDLALSHRRRRLLTGPRTVTYIIRARFTAEGAGALWLCARIYRGPSMSQAPLYALTW
jgi:hypothetical protein